MKYADFGLNDDDINPQGTQRGALIVFVTASYLMR